MPLDRAQFRAQKAKLDRTNFYRHLRQADRAAQMAGITLAGFTLVFSHEGESEVHYFGAPWLDPAEHRQVSQAVKSQIEEMLKLEGELCAEQPAQPEKTKTSI